MTEKPAPKALIFDVDGTLAETEEYHRAAFNRAFAGRGLGWEWDQTLYRRLLKTTGGKERIRAFQASLPEGAPRLSDDDIANIHAEKTRAYVAMMNAGEIELRPGVRDVIDAARRTGIRLAIATTTSRPNVDVLIRATLGQEATDVFEVIACGDEVAAKKPAPDVYLLALEKLDLPATDCLALEDSIMGLRSAQAAGIPTLVTPSSYTDDQDFSGAMAVVGTLEEALKDNLVFAATS